MTAERQEEKEQMERASKYMSSGGAASTCFLESMKFKRWKMNEEQKRRREQVGRVDTKPFNMRS